jgi:Fur family ferric uptake transcriptional regulator
MNKPEQLLKDYDLRATPGRQEVLTIFLQHDYALSHSDIEKDLPVDADRVTLYRTLKTFLDKGIIHKVLDDQGGLKYALCDPTCNHEKHNHNHVHFKCTICGQTTCLDVHIPDVKLPKGFTPAETNLLMQGICGNCNRG